MSDFITDVISGKGYTAGATSFTLLNAVAATGAGTAQAVTDPTKARAFVVSGTFVGTVAIQVSMDNSTWFTLGAALTAPGVAESTGPWKYVRGNVTAFTSGTITLAMYTYA